MRQLPIRRLHRWVILSTAAAGACALTGCVVHDNDPGPEPIWYPAFVIHESTAPATYGYTSPGPSNEPVGGNSGPVRVGAADNGPQGAILAGYHGDVTPAQAPVVSPAKP